MNQRGVDLKDYHDKGIFFMVASADVKYRSPSFYGDTIVVDTWITEFKGASFTFEYKITEKKTGRLIVTGHTKIVTADINQKPKRIDDNLIKKLTATTAAACTREGAAKTN